jgi:hypothetical protein
MEIDTIVLTKRWRLTLSFSRRDGDRHYRSHRSKDRCHEREKDDHRHSTRRYRRRESDLESDSNENKRLSHRSHRHSDRDHSRESHSKRHKVIEKNFYKID